MLPPFDELARADAATAKQDKLDLTIGQWAVVGNEPDGAMLLRELAAQPIPLPDNPNELTWFTAFQGYNFGGGRIDFRRGGPGGRILEGVPVVSGFLQAQRRGAGDPQSPTFFVLTATLSLNPTRFIRHRGAGRRTHLDPADWSGEINPLLLTTVRAPVRHRDEIVLDGNDNVLLTQRSQYAGRPEVWADQVRCYWRNIQDLLDRQIAETAASIDIHVTRPQTEINLRTCETYWEFSTDDALHTVSVLVPAFQGLGREASIRGHPLVEEGLEGSSLSVRVRLTTGITCTLYAKTTKRVRLEIKHDLMESAAVIGGSHTSDNPEDLMSWLGHLAEDAAGRANYILERLTHELSTTVPQRPVYEFLSRIAAASEDQATNDHLVSVLVNTRRIELRRNHDPFRQAVRRLVVEGVLERAAPHSQMFVIAPQYGWAIAELRGIRRRRAG